MEDWLLRTCELVRDYQPELLYFDWWIQHESFRPYLMRFLAYYYNLAAQEDRKVAVCYKQDALPFGSGIVEMERGGYGETQAFPWQMDTAIARNSWCYTQDLAYKTSKELLQNLVDVVAKMAIFCSILDPRQMEPSLSKIKTSSQRSGTGWR